MNNFIRQKDINKTKKYFQLFLEKDINYYLKTIKKY